MRNWNQKQHMPVRYHRRKAAHVLGADFVLPDEGIGGAYAELEQEG